jgi:tripartite-type tricarboxylate transporter receptor subunit TctC
MILKSSLGIAFVFILTFATTGNLATANGFDPKTRNIELIVSTPPGGALDTNARFVHEIFEKHGWKSVVINKPGADQSLGAKYTSQSKPDGHTILIGSPAAMGANMVKPIAGSSYRYEDFDHVVLMSSTSLVLLTSPNTGVKNYAEFQRWVRANPEKYSLGTWASFPSIVMQDIGRKEKLPEPVAVMFKGSAPTLTNLAGGHISFSIDTYLASRAFINSGRVVPLAVFDDGRANQLSGPKVMTKTYPEYEMYAWIGLNTAAGTPKEVIAEINRVINKGLQDPDMRKKIEDAGFRVHGGTSAEYKQLNDKTLVFMRKVFDTPYKELEQR